MSKTYYLVIDDDCRPALYPAAPTPITPSVPPCATCPPIATPSLPIATIPPTVIPTTPVATLPPVTPTTPIGTLPTATVVTDGSNLNIRRAPTTESEVIGRIPNGSTVTILEQAANGWYKIIYNGITGYVSGDWLRINSLPSEARMTQMRWRY